MPLFGVQVSIKHASLGSSVCDPHHSVSSALRAIDYIFAPVGVANWRPMVDLVRSGRTPEDVMPEFVPTVDGSIVSPGFRLDRRVLHQACADVQRATGTSELV